MTKQRLSLLTLLAFAMLALARPAYAEGSDKQLITRHITVEHFYANSDGTTKRVGTWEWLELRKYYDYLAREIFQPVASTQEFLKSPPSGDMYIVEEYDDIEGPMRRLVVQNGQIMNTTNIATHNYHFDVNELYPVLLKQLEKYGSIPTDPAGAILEITKTNPETGKKLSIYIKKKDDIALLKSYLDKLPSPLETEFRQIRLESAAPDAIRIKKIDYAFKDFPDEVRLAGMFMRVTTINRRSLTFKDTKNFARSIVEQKLLRDFYKSRGINNPPRTYSY